MSDIKHPETPAIHPLNEQDEYFFQEGCHIIELSNRPEDPALSIARARVVPGVTTKWHKLRDITERYVIQSGSGRVEVGELPPREVGPGDTVIIPPGSPQRISNVGNTDLVFLALCTPRFVVEAYEDLDME